MGVYADLVTAPVFKTGAAAEKSPGGFDSHPFPLSLVCESPAVVLKYGGRDCAGRYAA